MVPLPHLSPPMWTGQDPLSVSLWASSPGRSGGTEPLPEYLRELARRLFIRVWTLCILDSLGEEWTSQFWAQFMPLHKRSLKKKSQDFKGIWTRDLAIPVRCSDQVSYEATDVGSQSIRCLYVPVKEMKGDRCIWNKYMWTAEMKSSEEWSLLIKSRELFDRWKRTKDSLQPTKKFYDNSFIEDNAMSLSTWIWDFSRQGWTNSVQTVFKGKFFYWCEMCYMQSWSCSLARQALFFVGEQLVTRRLLCFLFRWLHYWGLSNIEMFF